MLHLIGCTLVLSNKLPQVVFMSVSVKLYSVDRQLVPLCFHMFYIVRPTYHTPTNTDQFSNFFHWHTQQ